MKKITTLLILAIFAFGSTTLFAGGDEWSASQKAEKESQEIEKDKEQKEKAEAKKKTEE